MRKTITITVKKDKSEIYRRLKSIVKLPAFRLYNTSEKKYSGEVFPDNFWFSWQRVLDLIMYGSPVVKGKLESNIENTSVILTIRDFSIYAILFFALVADMFLFYLLYLEFVYAEDPKVLGIILFITLIFTIVLLVFIRSRYAMKKMTKEVLDIFKDE